jgi:hypothetical protein
MNHLDLVIPELTKELLSQSRIIAKGQRIRDYQRLVETYGGRSSQWMKKSSPVFDVAGERYEFHWYEHHGIGRFEVKLKRISR